MLEVAWYRFRATLRRRWSGYLLIVLLIGLVGGVAMGSIAGARRTQATFPAYLSATDASDLQFQTSIATSGFLSANLTKKWARLPHVQHVASSPDLLVIPTGPDGKALKSAFNDDDVQAVGSEGGMYFAQDRMTVIEGRMAGPKSTDQMVATAEAARLSGWHLGETVRFGSYTLAQANQADFDPLTAEPSMRFSAKLVGLVVFSSQIVDDDVDRFPLERGRGRTAVPVRSALMGAALAVAVVVATVTFGSSLDTLDSHPALYGWNWTYAFRSGVQVGA